MPTERKLAAMMLTDIPGYTAFSAKYKTAAFKLLDTQKQILTPIYTLQRILLDRSVREC